MIDETVSDPSLKVPELQAALNQQSQEIAVINSIQEALAKRMDMQSIYDLVADRIIKIFNAPSLVIRTFDHTTGTEIWNYSIENGERQYVEPRPFMWANKFLIETRQPIHISENYLENVAQYGAEGVGYVVGKTPKSAVWVPMIIGDTVTGSVSLQDVNKENAFNESDVRLLTTITNSMHIALENAKLFDETNRLLKETEQSKAELAVINSVQEGLVREIDIQGIYNLVGNRIRDLFNAQVVIIASFDHENKLEIYNYHIEKGEVSLPKPRPFDKVRQYLIETGQNILINENVPKAVAEFGMRVVPGTEMPKSLLFMPMKVGEKVTGYVSLQNIDQEHAFSFSDVRLLSTLSNSMSVALQNARLFDETNRLLKETEQQKGELAVINSVQDGLAKALDMQSIYDLVGNRIRELFDAQVVGIATFDHNDETEHIHYLIEKGERYYPAPRPLNTLRKHLIENKEKVLINTNFEVVISAFGMKAVPGTQHPKSALYVPLVIGEKVTGYTSLQNLDKENAFSESDVRLLETLANTMGVALENARLFDETTRLLKETEQQKAELGVINSVQEGLAKELDIQAIYDLVGDRIRELFNAQAVMIVNFDHDTATEHFKYVIEDDQRFNLASRPYDKLRQHLIISKQKIVINTKYEEAYAKFGLKILPGTKMTKSGVFVPLITGDKVNSYISLQNSEIENAFSESDVRLLETLANSMSVALENARLFDETNRLLRETEQQKGELAVINSVQEGLARELDIHAIYQLVGDRLGQLFPDTQTLIIRTFDHDRELEHFEYFVEKKEAFKIEPRPFLWANKQLIQSKQSLYINENFVETSIKYGGTWVTKGEPPKSAVFVPMVVGNVVKGSISLQNVDRENAFSDSDIRLLGTLANSMSVALENARLFDETTRLLKETEQRTAELAVINSVQEGLAKELDMQGIYDLVGDRVQKLFNAQVVIIATFDLQKKNEHFNYFIEDHIKIKAEERPVSNVRIRLIKEKKMIYIRTEEETIKEFGPAVIGDTKMTKSLVFVPLMAGNEIRGYVSLQNSEIENAFSESDVRLLETLSNSMSVALENARLFDETNRLLKETEQRTAELAVINSVQDGLAKELDMQAIYDLVGDRIIKVFNAPNLVIRTFDHETGLENWRYAIEKGERQYIEPKTFGWHSIQLIKTQKPLKINDNYLETSKKFGGTGIFVGQQTKSGIFVPMIVGGVVKGSVSLQNVDKENAYDEADLRLLTTITNSMSVALENARLFDETNRLLKETEQRTSELAIITSVQEGLASKLEIQSIYDLVGDKIREVFDTQGIAISYYDRGSNLISHPYWMFKGKRHLAPAFELGKGLTSHVIQSAHPLIINENAPEKFKEFGAVYAASETEDAAKSWLGVPLISGGKVNGTIRLENYEKEFAYSESDVSLLQTLANSMSVALENARLFDETNRLLKETEQRTAELAVINSVQEGLAKELDMQGIYNLVGDRLCELFPDSQTLVIRTFHHETAMEHWQYAREKGVPQYVEPRPLNWNSKQLIKTKKPLDIQENYVETSKLHGGTGVTFGKPPKSAVFVPMVVGDVVKGSISLQNVDKENAFTESDLRLLTTITNSMSVALENARLFDETNRLLKETEQRTGELAVINSVQEGLVREMDMQAIYEIVGEKLCTLFNIQTVVIRTFDHDSGIEHWQYAKEKGERQYVEPRVLNWNSKQLIATKKPLTIKENYVETSKKYGGSGVTAGQPPKSAVFVPMIVGDVVKGSVSLQNVDRENAFSDSDIRLLTTLTNSMSVALENARLFDETTHLLAEAKQRATELSTVNNISKALASQLNAEELIQLVGDNMKNLFRANIVYLALLNPKTKIIHFPYQYGDDNSPMKLGEGLTSKIILTGEPLLINKNVQELRTKLGVEQMGKAAASYLGVPIPVGDEIIGVLSVQSTEHENQFNENDLRLLSTIASSVGVAFNNATLFEDVKQAKMEAEAASKAAEKANEAKSAFLSTVSHELRTPLTSVLGFAKIIRKRLDEKIFPSVNRTDPKTDKVVNQITENLGVVISEGERLTHLINDVLDLAKIEAGKMEWNVEDVSISEVAERALAATTALFDQKGLVLKKDIKNDLPPISGDRDKLIQVIINLISNSVKFTDEGSITLKVYQKKNEIIVGITDTGIGIAPEDHAAVFEQFKQVGGDTLTDKPKGTGLGLPICKEIVEHHGGRIWLESEAGKGSTFSFALPLSKEQASVKPVDLEKLVKQLKDQMSLSHFNGMAKNANILVVDDDDSIRSLLNQELSDAGYIVEEASNGKLALEAVRKNKPDLIILDIMMPEMNGFDVAAVLKNDPQTMDIPIIVLSIVQDKIRGFRIGVDRYLTKPIDTAQLFSEVGALLEQGKSKKKVMVVDEDGTAVKTLTDVLQTKGYHVVESNGKELVANAISSQPDIIILNSIHSDKQEVIQTLRFEKGLENVLFLIYQ